MRLGRSSILRRFRRHHCARQRDRLIDRRLHGHFRRCQSRYPHIRRTCLSFGTVEIKHLHATLPPHADQTPADATRQSVAQTMPSRAIIAKVPFAIGQQTQYRGSTLSSRKQGRSMQNIKSLLSIHSASNSIAPSQSPYGLTGVAIPRIGTRNITPTATNGKLRRSGRRPGRISPCQHQFQIQAIGGIPTHGKSLTPLGCAQSSPRPASTSACNRRQRCPQPWPPRQALIEKTFGFRNLPATHHRQAAPADDVFASVSPLGTVSQSIYAP